jgi:hypothetical protein
VNLLSLASRQIWPHVLLVADLKPQRLFLLHSENAAESRTPAQRLKRFFDQSNLVAKGNTSLVCVSDSDFSTIETQLDELQTNRQLLPSDCVVNFTGGNKLMATAAFRWAAKRGVRALYLERRNQLTWFEPRDGDVLTRNECVDGHLTDALDPLPLLRCQLDASEVDREGQLIHLNSAGQAVPEADFWKKLPSLTAEQIEPWLAIIASGNRKQNKGDALELIVAAALLRLGVKHVRRSLRLKVHTASGVSARLAHAELDLLFNFAGKLWLVDCKDRKPVTDLADGLRRISQPHTPADRQQYDELFERLRDQLSISDTKVIKEDLLAAREIGGLLGETICVRRAALSPEVREFARRNHVHLIENCRQPNALRDSLRSILHPQAPASLDQLAELQEQLCK